MAALFVRVKDPSTGHEYDVPETSTLLRRGMVRRVKPHIYPPSRYRRPAKHYLSLASRPAVQEAPAPLVGGDQQSPDTTEE